MQTLLLAAAELGPSKAPFYVLGGLLAAWAVLLSIIGLARPQFPASRAQFGMAASISVALAAATMAAVVLTS